MVKYVIFIHSDQQQQRNLVAQYHFQRRRYFGSMFSLIVLVCYSCGTHLLLKPEHRVPMGKRKYSLFIIIQILMCVFCLGYIAPITSFINVDIRRDRKLICIVCNSQVGELMRYHGVALLMHSLILYVEPESVTSICVGDGDHKHIYAITMCENTHSFEATSHYSCPIYNIRADDGSVVRPICRNVLDFMPSTLDSLLSNLRINTSTQTEEQRPSLQYADLQNLPSTSTGISGRIYANEVNDTSKKCSIETKKNLPSSSHIKTDQSRLRVVKKEHKNDSNLTASVNNPLYHMALTDDQAMVFRETHEVPSNIPNFTQALYLFILLRLKRFIERSAESDGTYFDEFIYYCFAAILNGDFSLLTTLLEM